MQKLYWVYIMASRRRGALYIGVTNHLGRRIHEHRIGIGSEHADRYRIWKLVYIESYADIREAIAREKQLKRWRRQWKFDLIERANDPWDDLYRLPLPQN
jgi:putative endonuclease